MSAASGRRGPSALDLLMAFLDKDEQIAVLRFAQDRQLDTDSEVFFLISLLKVFAHVVQLALDALAKAETGRKTMEATVIMAEERLGQTMEEEVDFFQNQMAQATAMMGHEASRFEKIAQEITALHGGLRAVTGDAARVLDAYHAAKGDQPAVPLARLYFNQFKAELNKRAPNLDQGLRDLIVETVALQARRVLAAVGGATLLLAALILWLHR